ncbi:MAG: cupin domain-containing protein [Coprothermobacterota bacterium]|nr:cupin domain-containing protein [Coprothermobacterota bacterium]
MDDKPGNEDLPTNETKGRALHPVLRQVALIPEEQVGDGSWLRQIFHPAHLPLTTRHSLSYARLEGGKQTRPHSLEQSETYYLLAGRGLLHVGEQAFPLEPGSICWVPPGVRQWLRNEGEESMEFLVIVDPPWTPEGDSAENCSEG